MTVAVLLPLPDLVVLKARAEGAGGARGDLVREIRPGESFLGWRYDELRQLGEGLHELEPKSPPPPAA